MRRLAVLDPQQIVNENLELRKRVEELQSRYTPEQMYDVMDNCFKLMKENKALKERIQDLQRQLYGDDVSFD